MDDSFTRPSNKFTYKARMKSKRSLTQDFSSPNKRIKVLRDDEQITTSKRGVASIEIPLRLNHHHNLRTSKDAKTPSKPVDTISSSHPSSETIDQGAHPAFTVSSPALASFRRSPRNLSGVIENQGATVDLKTSARQSLTKNVPALSSPIKLAKPFPLGSPFKVPRQAPSKNSSKIPRTLRGQTKTDSVTQNPSHPTSITTRRGSLNTSRTRSSKAQVLGNKKENNARNASGSLRLFESQPHTRSKSWLIPPPRPTTRARNRESGGDKPGNEDITPRRSEREKRRARLHAPQLPLSPDAIRGEQSFFGDPDGPIAYSTPIRRMTRRAAAEAKGEKGEGENVKTVKASAAERPDEISPAKDGQVVEAEDVFVATVSMEDSPQEDSMPSNSQEQQEHLPLSIPEPDTSMDVTMSSPNASEDADIDPSPLAHKQNNTAEDKTAALAGMLSFIKLHKVNLDSEDEADPERNDEDKDNEEHTSSPDHRHDGQVTLSTSRPNEELSVQDHPMNSPSPSPALRSDLSAHSSNSLKAPRRPMSTVEVVINSVRKVPNAASSVLRPELQPVKGLPKKRKASITTPVNHPLPVVNTRPHRPHHPPQAEDDTTPTSQVDKPKNFKVFEDNNNMHDKKKPTTPHARKKVGRVIESETDTGTETEVASEVGDAAEDDDVVLHEHEPIVEAGLARDDLVDGSGNWTMTIGTQAPKTGPLHPPTAPKSNIETTRPIAAVVSRAQLAFKTARVARGDEDDSSSDDDELRLKPIKKSKLKHENFKQRK